MVSGLPVRLRRGLSLVLLLNLALGMAFSVIFLRHQVDARHDVTVQVAELDRLVAVHSLARETARDDPNPAAAGAVGASGSELRTAADRLRDSDPRIDGAEPLVAEVERYLATDATDPATGPPGPTTAGQDAATAESVHRLAAALGARQRSEDGRAGTVADVETLLIMLFAAGMGALLVRRLLAARQAELSEARRRAQVEARFRSLIHHSADLISVLDMETVVRYQSPSLVTMLGWEPAALRNTPLRDLVHPEDLVAFLSAHRTCVDSGDSGATAVSEVRLRHADGSWRHFESVHTNLLDEAEVGGVVMNSRDVTERVALAERLEHSALHDPLTGLANRVLFGDRMEQALSRDEQRHAGLALLFCDLDGFKQVNDHYGHAAGDHLLTEVAARLIAAAGPHVTVARLGGDEFALLLDHVDAAETVLALAQDVVTALEEPFAVPLDTDEAVSVSASVGLVLGADLTAAPRSPAPAPATGTGTAIDGEELLRCADIAMYLAKRGGAGRVVRYEAGMGDAVLARLQLRSELAAALDRQEFAVHYQPTVDLRTGAMHGVEALVRWNSPSRGLVPPLAFVPTAEESGLIVGLGRWVLAESCRHVAAWQRRHPDHAQLQLAVNVSARELAEPDLVDVVLGVLAGSGLPPTSLTLEVTESLMMADVGQAAAALERLRATGVRVAIDDFGTGYSSLSYLEDLSVDYLKIDKSFVDKLTAGRGEFVVIESILHLGHALGLSVVAEGVEHAGQLEQLRAMECDFGQGYLFARPLPADELEALLTGSAGPFIVDAPTGTVPAQRQGRPALTND